MNREQLLKENELRKVKPAYNPVSGLGCYGSRTKVVVEEWGELYLTEPFLAVSWVAKIVKHKSIKKYCEVNGIIQYYDGIVREFIKERCKHDCEYWMATFCNISIKNRPKDAPLIPSKTQRKVLYYILEDWYAERPVRFIVVKCRQAFISTLVAAFNTWVQLNIFTSWNSLICGDVDSQSSTIRGMQDKMIKSTPAIFTETHAQYEITPFEGSNKTRIIKQRDCKISTGSMQKPENVRSGDNMSAHCTECGLWRETKGKTPEDLIQAIRGGMDDVAYTVFGMESSPKGVGNYFYDQWIFAKSGDSDLRPIFLPWFWVDRYSKQIAYTNVFFDSWEKHEKKDYLDYLWSLGCTLEQINWYMGKLKTMEHWRVQSEWPSDDVEAFQSTGRRLFPINEVNRRRNECVDPIAECDVEAEEFKGENALVNVRFGSLTNNLKIWSYPDKLPIRNRYLVIVDVGKGKRTGSDYSDILVLDRYGLIYDDRIDIAAEWHGKIDVDLLAWKAAQIGHLYNDALLVIEKNTIDTMVDYSSVLLSEIASYYPNIYCKVSVDKVKGTKETTYGFHTNTNSKPRVVTALQAALRDDLYYERNKKACDELDVYEQKEDGTFGAADKCHDDMVMVRAIGMHVSSKMDLPEEVTEIEFKTRKVIGYSSM